MGKIMHGGIEYSGGGGGGATTLAALTDVAVASPSDGQVLEYDAASSKWKNADASGGGGVNYSTQERVIGTWIDGKPLYQKTIDFGVMPSSTTKSVVHGISNIKRIVSIEGYSFNSTAGNLTVPLPFVSTSALGSQMDIRCDFTNVTVITGTGRQNFAESFVTLRYTKTTD
jgi:hypothetical protein